ncbi:rhomboid family intramembrane serine protease [Mesorhizobium sp. LHD-90]|uniref:rhomboid family intramembrane serine protease n=1 Tax=Mesorhizobium sp. LHD-90 TaxID=3071414 RepID=UPI0027E1C935|nr:rhomboid family intramembrane serine protease [Mesorhizobium sp. LHD-90]MDQ6437923.1 rhomboid family intramembrane serine protease [Mesorhizobium sp. LHD-90]
MSEQPARTIPPEPRERPREPVFNMPGVVVLLIAICAMVHVVSVYALNRGQYGDLLLRAAFIPIRYSGMFDLDVYAFTTPFTYTFLHGDWLHLGINMVWLAAFGSPLANRLGTLRFLLFWAVTGLSAAALHWAIHPLDQGPLIGASGAISGMMGAATRFAFRIERRGNRASFGGPVLPVSEVFRSRGVVTFLAFWMLTNLATGYFGFGPGAEAAIAWEAHIGGFVAGFLGVPYFLGKLR